MRVPAFTGRCSCREKKLASARLGLAQSARVRLQIVRGRSVPLPVAGALRGRYVEVLCELRESAFEINATAVQPLVGCELDRNLVAVPHGELHRIKKHRARGARSHVGRRSYYLLPSEIVDAECLFLRGSDLFERGHRDLGPGKQTIKGHWPFLIVVKETHQRAGHEIVN